VLDEGSEIEGALASLREVFRGEVLVVDGGSSDDTVERALKTERKVLHAAAGIASQCNFGAGRATGDILFFVGADVRLPPDFHGHILSLFRSPYVAAGGFRLHIAGQGFFFKLISWGGNWRSRTWQMTFPDQGLFVRRDYYEKLGGMDSSSRIPFAKFCRAVSACGEFVILPEPVVSSPRKWLQHGKWRTTFHHLKVFSQFLCAEGRRP